MAMAGGRDWSQLNPDLLYSISESLTDITDHLHFRSVCSKWRSASSPTPPHPRPLPWLLLIPHSDDSPHHVVTPLDRRIYSLRTPFSQPMKFGYAIFGSPFGLFLFVDHEADTISLVDPLPGGSWTTYDFDFMAIQIHTGQTDIRLAKILSMDPLVLLVLVGDSNRAPFVWRQGEPDFTPIWPQEEIGELPDDVTLYKGHYYIVTSENKTYVVNSSNLRTVRKFKCPVMLSDEEHEVCKYLVESSSGDLLLVVWDNSVSILVFRLVGRKWEKVTSIGDDTLFLAEENVICFPSGRFPGYMGNCVYFIPGRLWMPKVNIFDIAKNEVIGSFEELTRDANTIWVSNAQWFCLQSPKNILKCRPGVLKSVFWSGVKS